MRVALVNPPWTFDGSIYFGCREPHLPLEFGYAQARLRAAGHDAEIIDAQLGALTRRELQLAVDDYAPDLAVVTTTPSYLFWRCPPPELRVPQEVVADLRESVPAIVAVGPHASSTPRTALDKLGADAVVIGECEEVLPALAAPRSEWARIESLCSWVDGVPRVTGPTRVTDMSTLPALAWPMTDVHRHRHHHHRFDAAPAGPGAEMETSRGCPYHCTFCAKDNFRNAYRRRPLAVILEELDRLLAQGIEYVYFIDEIFLPNRELLEALAGRGVRIGVQTRIDLWNEEMLALLGRAGCVSIEAGVESISEQGRNLLDKNSRLTTDQISARLITAREHVPFVQANLIDCGADDEARVEAWRDGLQRHGVWANTPVPLFPYPGSPDYTKRWGAPDDGAWERAMSDYLTRHQRFSDIQSEHPRPLQEIEHARAGQPGGLRSGASGPP